MCWRHRRESGFGTDRGFTLLELSMAAFLSSLVLSSVVLLFSSVSQGASDARKRADLQAEARAVVSVLANELRAAEPPRAGGTAVEALSEGSVAFFSDRFEFPGPERILYERVSCSGGFCQLRVRRYAANPESGPDWTFLTTPFNDVVVLERIVAGDTLFSGTQWGGSPLRRTTVAPCGDTTRCDFPIVTINLRAAPPGVSTIDGPFGVFVEVNLRNA